MAATDPAQNARVVPQAPTPGNRAQCGGCGDHPSATTIDLVGGNEWEPPGGDAEHASAKWAAPTRPPTQEVTPVPGSAGGARWTRKRAGIPTWVWVAIGVVAALWVLGTLGGSDNERGYTPATGVGQTNTTSATSTPATLAPARDTADFARQIRARPNIASVQELLDETTAQASDGDFEIAAEFADLGSAKFAELRVEAAQLSDGSEAAAATVEAFAACEIGWRTVAETLRAKDPETNRTVFEEDLDVCNDKLALSRVLLNDAERSD